MREVVERRNYSPGNRIFLLSPATLAGARAEQLASPRARFETARLLRSPAGLPIADAFSFMSSLYFRGKIAYARRFAAPPAALPGCGIFVIAPGFGLVSPDWPLTLERMETLRRTPVDVKSRAYSLPLREHARMLAGMLGEAQAILLGSIATGKYLDVLSPVLGDRLRFPSAFVGAGDMRRGSLLLRAAASGEELDYSPIGQPRRGSRPARAEAP